MNEKELYKICKDEESIAHIKGWDFSHLHGRYTEEDDLPWDYDKIVRYYLKPEMRLLDYDTGGGEYLLSLCHPYENTAATEGYPPNFELCKSRLTPLGIDLRFCKNAAEIPFDDGSFDMVINRHGDFDAKEAYRILKPGGVFVMEQVGSDNDRDLVKKVLPDAEIPFPDLNLLIQAKGFEKAGFKILQADEAYRPIEFYDVGAFVWFARIIEWEFPGFSVDNCFDKLLLLQSEIENTGKISGTIHRYMIAVKKRT